MGDLLLGLDIGGTKCAVCVGTGDGTVLAKRSFPTDEPNGWRPAVKRLLAIGDELLAGRRPAAIGISCGSPLDADRGIIQAPAQLPSWVDVPLGDIAAEHFVAPAFLENDANACAIAEHRYGAGRGARDVIFLTFGTGMGAGLILNGRIHRGATVYAGEVGHLRLSRHGPVGCRKAGSFEGWCSGAGIAQIAASERLAWSGPATCLPPAASARDVAQGADAGDALSRHVLAVSGHHLGLGLAVLLDVLNPERVVIGSIFARCERHLRPAMERALAEEALDQTRAACRIVAASLGEAVGDVAALAVAQDGLAHQAGRRQPAMI